MNPIISLGLSKIALDTATAMDWWGYLTTNPFALGFTILFAVLIGLLLIIMVFRWWDTSHEHIIDRQYMQMMKETHDQEMLNMQLNRELDRDYNQATVRQINASATLLEQTGNTLAIVNQLLAAKGGVSIAIEAGKLIESNSKENSQAAK